MNYFRFIGKAIAALFASSLLFMGCHKNDNTPDEPENPEPDVPEVAGHFTFSVTDVTASTCLLNIKRDDPSKAFYYAYVDKSSLESFGDDFQTQAKAYLQGNIDFIEDMFGTSREETMEGLTSSEDIENEAVESLTADTEYLIIAAYVNADGTTDGDFEKYGFRTEDVAPSDNKFTLQVEELTARSLTLSVGTSNNDQYTVSVTPFQDVADLSDAEIMKYIISLNSIFIPTYSGELASEQFKLDAGTKYIIAVFGVDSGKATTGLTKQVFTSPEGGKPADWNFTATFSDADDVHGYKMNVAIVPNDNTVDYCYELVDARYTAAAFKAEYEANVAEMVNNVFGGDFALYYQLFATYGEDNATYVINPTLEYKIAGFAVDTKVGKIAGDIHFSETYKPSVPVQSDAKIEVSWPGFYDGTAIADRDSEYESFRGLAVFPAKVTTTPEDLTFFYNVYQYDGTDYTRDAIITALLSDGASYADICFVPFDTDAIVYAIAVDADGNCSQVFEKQFKCTRNDVSPVEDFFSQVASTPYSRSSAAPAQDKEARAKAAKVNADGTRKVFGHACGASLRPLR